MLYDSSAFLIKLTSWHAQYDPATLKWVHAATPELHFVAIFCPEVHTFAVFLYLIAEINILNGMGSQFLFSELFPYLSLHNYPSTTLFDLRTIP